MPLLSIFISKEDLWGIRLNLCNNLFIEVVQPTDAWSYPICGTPVVDRAAIPDILDE